MQYVDQCVFPSQHILSTYSLYSQGLYNVHIYIWTDSLPTVSTEGSQKRQMLMIKNHLYEFFREGSKKERST
jgi:hypothetical protein